MGWYEWTMLGLAVVTAVGVLADLYVDLRETKPIRRLNALRELAKLSVTVAEQRAAGTKMTNFDKALYARARLIEWAKLARHSCSPQEAEALVEWAVAQMD